MHQTTTRLRALSIESTEKSVSGEDRKSTRLNFSHRTISYAVFCLKKKKKKKIRHYKLTTISKQNPQKNTTHQHTYHNIAIQLTINQTSKTITATTLQELHITQQRT